MAPASPGAIVVLSDSCPLAQKDELRLLITLLCDKLPDCSSSASYALYKFLQRRGDELGLHVLLVFERGPLNHPFHLIIIDWAPNDVLMLVIRKDFKSSISQHLFQCIYARGPF